ncbi:metalloregulator ArsR/SmtB family transcription factor [Flavobacteriaceae bacterium F89]|uniref:Metalloregulator ArsR/SmtB family transcription factor n=1 Tax=Cerina litoralis TaxID=2874477 RepID=A0AAE3JQZ5_9FLAO|nr:metalloregulator ArsR/SmtB family transcription factor [Cerina litoralis]MCG2462676.1 metalloregulator ArsR/SmtB family transcription factor [Cerina litoralis]
MNLEITCTRKEADHKQLSRCRETLQSSFSSFQEISRIFALAGSEVRLKILFLLNMEKELCPCDIADILEMSVPAISQHIRKMKDVGIISMRRDGQTLYYSLVKENTNVLNKAFSTIDNNRKVA